MAGVELPAGAPELPRAGADRVGVWHFVAPLDLDAQMKVPDLGCMSATTAFLALMTVSWCLPSSSTSTTPCFVVVMKRPVVGAAARSAAEATALVEADRPPRARASGSASATQGR